MFNLIIINIEWKSFPHFWYLIICSRRQNIVRVNLRSVANKFQAYLFERQNDIKRAKPENE